MRISFVSPNEPFYLPEFYDSVFKSISNNHEVKLIVVPPLYGKNGFYKQVMKFYKSFGLRETCYLAGKTILYRFLDAITSGSSEKFYSLRSICNKHGINLMTFKDINGEESLRFFQEWGVDLIISVSCPQIFRRRLINIPRIGCLNLHGSLLPSYKGIMPSFWMLLNDEKEGGVTLFFMNEEIDGGEVFIQKSVPIYPDDSLHEYIRRSKKVGAEVVTEGISIISDGGDRNVKSEYFVSGPKGEPSYFGWPARKDVKSFTRKGKKFR